MGGLHHRKSIRLPGHDYSTPGAYFLTLRTNHEKNLFGHLWNGKMYLNEFGRIVRDEWLKSMTIRQEIILDEFTILPDHFHAIVWIIETDQRSVYDRFVGATGRSPLQTVEFEQLNNNESVLQFHKFTPYNSSNRSSKIQPRSISSLIGGFKSSATSRINQISHHIDSVWQRSFYDRLIRDEFELFKKREYIQNNPEKHWLRKK